jgi:PAS domain S-box-containing protein
MLIKGFSKNSDYIRTLESVIESTYDGVYITDRDANTIYVNKSYERITGLNRDELLGRNMAELVREGIMSEATSYWVLTNKMPITIQQSFNTGKNALVTSIPCFDESGNITMIVTNVRDITELRELQEKDKQRKNEASKYKSIIQELKMQIADNDTIIVEDEKMLELLLLAKRVANVDTTILIEGETGSGKEVLSKYIYNNSSRKDKPYIKINCGAIPENLIESELFGYVEGSFTGALKGGKIGSFEAANNGTILLDEIGELPQSMQVKLLRVLQDGEIEKVGSNVTVKVNVRVIAASNRNLMEMVKNGKFREDLYYRLNVVTLRTIPLRERRSSIIPLVEHFIHTFNKKYDMNKTLSSNALKYLYEYDWPGNVRELRNLMEMMVVTTVDNIINADQLPDKLNKEKGQKFDCLKGELPTLEAAVGELERELIINAYEKYGNVRDAAKILGISPATFVRKKSKYV